MKMTIKQLRDRIKEEADLLESDGRHGEPSLFVEGLVELANHLTAIEVINNLCDPDEHINVILIGVRNLECHATREDWTALELDETILSLQDDLFCDGIPSGFNRELKIQLAASMIIARDIVTRIINKAANA